MNVSQTIPATVQIRRSRLLGLVAGVAAVAAVVTWAVLTFGVDGGSGRPLAGAQSQTYSLPIPGTIVTRATGDPGYSLPIPGMVVTSPIPGSSLIQQRYVEGISSLTPLERAATFGGTGSVVDALELGAQGERYVERITSLLPRERAAAFGQ